MIKKLATAGVLVSFLLGAGVGVSEAAAGYKPAIQSQTAKFVQYDGDGQGHESNENGKSDKEKGKGDCCPGNG